MTLADWIFKIFLFIALVVFTTSGIMGAFALFNEGVALLYTAAMISFNLLFGAYLNRTITNK